MSNSQGADSGRGEGSTVWWWICETGTKDYRGWGKIDGDRGGKVIGGRSSGLRRLCVRLPAGVV